MADILLTSPVQSSEDCSRIALEGVLETIMGTYGGCLLRWVGGFYSLSLRMVFGGLFWVAWDGVSETFTGADGGCPFLQSQAFVLLDFGVGVCDRSCLFGRNRPAFSL